MTGILLLIVAAAWVAFCAAMPYVFVWRIKNVWLRAIAALIFFAVLLPLPLIDELIGKQQFETLCSTKGIENADTSRAKGRRVNVGYSERRPIEETVLPTLASDVTYRDSVTGEVLIRHKDYYSGGGWLMRSTWINMGSAHPMLFSGNGCGFGARDRLFETEKISVVN
jgi:hypothetical protein